MSQENVDTFRRGVEAYNRRDVDALIADADPGIEWYPAILGKLSGKDTVHRGRRRTAAADDGHRRHPWPRSTSSFRRFVTSGTRCSGWDASERAGKRAGSSPRHPSGTWLISEGGR
jgi:hypothetical protein